MMAKTVPNKLAIWVEAQKKYHLTDIQVQMARAWFKPEEIRRFGEPPARALEKAITGIHPRVVLQAV